MAMHILVTGETSGFIALQKLIPPTHIVEWVNFQDLYHQEPGSWNLLIDTTLDDNPERLDLYSTYSNRPVMGRAVKHSLAAMASKYGKNIECALMGINCLPGFDFRPHLEISLFQSTETDTLENIMSLLGLPYTLVADRPGMVSPRIITMIINEAAFLLQEEGATQKGIDTAMKLGTNYPFGPLEWADTIGVGTVVEILDAIYEDTHDDRYKVAPLLRRMALIQEKFYS